MTFAPGTRLGPYEIAAPLGAGGMGEVYRAKDTRLAREVALKVLPGEFLESKERIARFEREARSLAALSHPNILAIHDFGADRGGVEVDAAHGEDLAEVVAVGRSRRHADLTAVARDVVGVRHRPTLWRVWQVDGLVRRARTEQRTDSVDHVFGVPAQRDGRSLRVGDLGLDGVATDEVVIEAGHVLPSHLDGCARARPEVVGVDRTRRGKGRTHHRPEFGVDSRYEGPGDLGEPAFDVVDEVGPPAEAFDAELLAGLVHRVVDRGAVGDGAVQLVREIAGHADPSDFGLDAVDGAVPEAQEADVAQALAGHLLQDVQRGRACDLEQVLVETFDLNVVGDIERRHGAGRSARERLELVVCFAFDDAVRGNQSRVVAHHCVFHAADGELREAVDDEALEILLCLGTLD